MKPFFACAGIRKSYAGRVVLPGVDLRLEQGSVTALVGTSGCGKSTLLHILAGFLPPDAGAVFLEGAPCVRPGPERIMAFQNDALFPWLSVAENVALGLRQAGCSRRERCERVAAVLEQVGLSAWGAALPSVLSGGMRQRAALARALALRPRLLFLDEPFAALDAITRLRMQQLLARLQAEAGLTVVLVTHDVGEACLLADAVHLMEEGRGLTQCWQVASPRPRDPDAAAQAALRARIRQALSAAAGGATAQGEKDVGA
ncbi:ABC transporter ATP-binding protein [Desulfovibrio legallii]|uniref:NitT/TauT family transport system ATP-binding protein/taurine transport system ATP-binding protein n=1 Tax=Desulfovibrio legallii TaxID=571438 RepID=A0A1G7NMP7_9BACT|nr:ABC transporter ATP-binding protein [Desulfovibrio legallii]SDF75197.1 NitT/TauT family transport system ATP-binding protein/taurine transport system ATP-binding protein [Desulfovibrio legallii]